MADSAVYAAELEPGIPIHVYIDESDRRWYAVTDFYKPLGQTAPVSTRSSSSSPAMTGTTGGG
jgi:hypothetical protein